MFFQGNRVTFFFCCLLRRIYGECVRQCESTVVSVPVVTDQSRLHKHLHIVWGISYYTDSTTAYYKWFAMEELIPIFIIYGVSKYCVQSKMAFMAHAAVWIITTAGTRLLPVSIACWPQRVDYKYWTSRVDRDKLGSDSFPFLHLRNSSCFFVAFPFFHSLACWLHLFVWLHAPAHSKIRQVVTPKRVLHEVQVQHIYLKNALPDTVLVKGSNVRKRSQSKYVALAHESDTLA